MSFVARTISRTADGRQIVRSRALDQPEISIGRDPSCDIHLPDLAVTLRHAMIRWHGPARVEVVATAGLPVDVNGRSVERADVNPAQQSTVRIGAHALTIARGEGDEARAVIVTIERVGALSDASEAKDEAKAFSLAGIMPTKRAMAWALVALTLIAFLAWPIAGFLLHRAPPPGQPPAARAIAFHADESWSPGKLSLAHAALENDCRACHQKAFVSVRDDSCLACHAKVHDHADPRRLAAAKSVMPGFGGKVTMAFKGAFNLPAGRCIDCHTEHQGATAMPATAQKFCTDCHGTLDRRLTDTKILDVSDFGTDHPQFRPAVMTEAQGPVVQRISLDARPLEDEGLTFPHAEHLSAGNGVAQMARTVGMGRALKCASCHVPDPSGSRFVPVTFERNCAACHSLAFDRVGGTVRTLRHGDPAQVVADLRALYRAGGPSRAGDFGGNSRRRPGRFAAPAGRVGDVDGAIRAVFAAQGICGECHRVTQTGGGGFAVVPVRLAQRYMAKGWFDHASHSTETCESCHAARASHSASDVLLPKIAECRTCHGGESARKQVPSSCAMCHDYHRNDGTPLMRRVARARGMRPNTIAANPSATGG